jgi:hypothetical protein
LKYDGGAVAGMSSPTFHADQQKKKPKKYIKVCLKSAGRQSYKKKQNDQSNTAILP